MRPSLVAQDQCWRLKCQRAVIPSAFGPIQPVRSKYISRCARAGLCRPCPGDRFVQLLIINLKTLPVLLNPNICAFNFSDLRSGSSARRTDPCSLPTRTSRRNPLVSKTAPSVCCAVSSGPWHCPSENSDTAHTRSLAPSGPRSEVRGHRSQVRGQRGRGRSHNGRLGLRRVAGQPATLPLLLLAAACA